MLKTLFLLFQTAPAPAGFDFTLVTTLTAFIVAPTKVLVDVVKNAWTTLPSNKLPLIGLVIAYACCLVVLVAAEIAFKPSVFAQCGIAAVGAQVGAMAVTGLQNKAQKVDEKIEAALNMDSTKTRADVDAKVKADAAKG